MSLTRRLLKDLELNDHAIERIIAAHADTVDALTRQRDEAQHALASLDALTAERDDWRTRCEQHQAESNRIQQEYEAYRIQVDDHLHRTARRDALRDALRRHGANEQAIPLLVDALPIPEDAWNGDKLADETCLTAARAKYGPLFSTCQALPTSRVDPPISQGGALTRDDLRRMSPQDINRNWSSVAAALGR